MRHFEGDPTLVVSLAFSPDGRYALAESADAIVRLWDVQLGKEICRLEGHSDFVRSVAFSPDGHYVLSLAVKTEEPQVMLIRDSSASQLKAERWWTGED